MKPLSTILKITITGVMVFALNACDKKSADDADITASTQTTQQSTQNDGASASDTGANAQTATPAQGGGVAIGGTQNGEKDGDEQNNAATNGDNGQNHTQSGNTNTGSNNDGNGANGGDGNNTTSGGNDQNTPALKTLTLSIDTATLNKDTNTTLNVQAAYSDKSTKDVTSRVQWMIAPKDAVKIEGNTLAALKDGNVTVQAKYQNRLSDKINLNIYWEVNGHRLPPEPDPVKNNATLLGIDVNNNGIRDDVERWIYNKYKDKHPIHIDIAMQAARGYRLVLETPERAKEIRLKVDAALFCGWYYQNDAYRYNDPTLVHERIDSSVSSQYFNTKERKDTYLQYDKLLSGGVYDLPRSKQRKALCDFNTSKYSKE